MSPVAVAEVKTSKGPSSKSEVDTNPNIISSPEFRFTDESFDRDTFDSHRVGLVTVRSLLFQSVSKFEEAVPESDLYGDEVPQRSSSQKANGIHAVGPDSLHLYELMPSPHLTSPLSFDRIVQDFRSLSDTPRESSADSIAKNATTFGPDLLIMRELDIPYAKKPGDDQYSDGDYVQAFHAELVRLTNFFPYVLVDVSSNRIQERFQDQTSTILISRGEKVGDSDKIERIGELLTESLKLEKPYIPPAPVSSAVQQRIEALESASKAENPRPVRQQKPKRTTNPKPYRGKVQQNSPSREQIEDLIRRGVLTRESLPG